MEEVKGITNGFYEKVQKIQEELKAPKNQFNKFGNYAYRSCEDIYNAVKPLLAKYGLVLTVTDELVMIGERYYIKATATLQENAILYIRNVAYAREEETKKGMDGSQITGASSSYARKYALNGLFLIDDVRDSDTTNTHGKEYVNDEVNKKTYRSWFDKFFSDKPERLGKFLEHYKIKSTDQIDQVLKLDEIDELISKLKKDNK